MRVHTCNSSIRQEVCEFKDILDFIVKPLRERNEQREKEGKRGRESERQRDKETIPHNPLQCNAMTLKTRTQNLRTDAKTDEKRGLGKLLEALKHNLSSSPRQTARLGNSAHPLYLETFGSDCLWHPKGWASGVGLWCRHWLTCIYHTHKAQPLVFGSHSGETEHGAEDTLDLGLDVL